MKKLILLITVVLLSLYGISQPGTPSTPTTVIDGKLKIGETPSSTGTDSVLMIDPTTKEVHQKSLSDLSSSVVFDGNREILRVPSATDNLGTSTIDQWLEWWYFVAPTISVTFSPSTQTYEVGTSTSINIIATTSNPGSATLSNGKLYNWTDAIELKDFGSGTGDTESITYTPKETPSTQYEKQQYVFRAEQDWVFGAESGSLGSSRTLSAYYRVFWGISSTDFEGASGTTIYTNGDLSSNVQAEATLAKSFTGTGYMWIITPDSWDDISLVTDDIGSPVTGFTDKGATVSSTGLVNDYTDINYKCWRSATQGTFSGQTYTIYF